MGFPLGGLAQALGLGIQGYGLDQQRRTERARQQLLDSQGAERLGMERQRFGMDQQVHGVQMQNLQSEIRARDATSAATERFQTTLSSPEFQETYKKALGGDQDAIASVSSTLAGHSNEQALLAPLTRVPPRDPVKDHAANRDYDNQHPEPTKEHWVGAGVGSNGLPVILNSVTGETKEGGGLRSGSAGAEPPEVAASRKDLKGLQGQQVRAEHDVTAVKSDLRALTKDHPRAVRPLADQHTAVDSSFANQYSQGQSALAAAEGRKKQLTTSADSIQDVIAKLRAGASIPQLLRPNGDAPTSEPPASAPMSGLQRVQRARQESDGFTAAVSQIKAHVADPVEQQRRIFQAQQIFNQRMQKVNAGLDPDQQ